MGILFALMDTGLMMLIPFQQICTMDWWKIKTEHCGSPVHPRVCIHSIHTRRSSYNIVINPETIIQLPRIGLLLWTWRMTASSGWQCLLVEEVEIRGLINLI